MKLNDQDRRDTVRRARKKRRMAFGELRNQATADISTTTVPRVLTDAGYHRRVARGVPYLKKVHRRGEIMAWNPRTGGGLSSRMSAMST
jgi:hypothetical protein